jgi:hypothetical protein
MIQSQTWGHFSFAFFISDKFLIIGLNDFVESNDNHNGIEQETHGHQSGHKSSHQKSLNFIKYMLLINLWSTIKWT